MELFQFDVAAGYLVLYLIVNGILHAIAVAVRGLSWSALAKLVDADGTVTPRRFRRLVATVKRAAAVGVGMLGTVAVLALVAALVGGLGQHGGRAMLATWAVAAVVAVIIGLIVLGRVFNDVSVKDERLEFKYFKGIDQIGQRCSIESQLRRACQIGDFEHLDLSRVGAALVVAGIGGAATLAYPPMDDNETARFNAIVLGTTIGFLIVSLIARYVYAPARALDAIRRYLDPNLGYRPNPETVKRIRPRLRSQLSPRLLRVFLRQSRSDRMNNGSGQAAEVLSGVGAAVRLGDYASSRAALSPVIPEVVISTLENTAAVLVVSDAESYEALADICEVFDEYGNPDPELMKLTAWNLRGKLNEVRMFLDDLWAIGKWCVAVAAAAVATITFLSQQIT